MKERKHKAEQEALNSRLSAPQIRANKIEKCRVRGERRRAFRMELAQERLEYWRGLTLKQQLTELDSRPGESKKQRARIVKRISELEDMNNG